MLSAAVRNNRRLAPEGSEVRGQETRIDVGAGTVNMFILED